MLFFNFKSTNESFVECNATEKLEKFRFGQFEKFAISAKPIGNWTLEPETLKYPLYPERPDKAGWKHSKVKDLLKDAVFDHSIHYAVNNTDNGYRVNNFTCWSNLVQFFNNVTQSEQIELGKKPNRVDEVKIVGKLNSRA